LEADKILEPMTLEQFYKFVALPENLNSRFEFFNGFAYAMASPSYIHSKIVGFIYRKMSDYFDGKTCEPIIDLDVHFIGSFGQTDILVPDLFINCKPERINKNFCQGAPEFALEVVSPSSFKDDYYTKQSYYLRHGVKEYWVVDYERNCVTVSTAGSIEAHSFSDDVKVRLFEGLSIDFNSLRKILTRNDL
jgi:Uma2 family endonuclease